MENSELFFSSVTDFEVFNWYINILEISLRIWNNDECQQETSSQTDVSSWHWTAPDAAQMTNLIEYFLSNTSCITTILWNEYHFFNIFSFCRSYRCPSLIPSELSAFEKLNYNSPLNWMVIVYFGFRLHLHLCAVIHMTEIILTVT